VTRATVPAHGRGADALLADLEARKAKDTDWKRGRVFSLVYHAGDEHSRLLERAHALFASGNLLNPMAFQSLRGLEAEITQMAADLMHGGPDTVGAVTSGGTESILVAVAAYRDRARQHKPWIRRPTIVLPVTAHPAFDKAAHYFGVRLKKVAVDADQRVDVRALERAIGPSTIAVVVSAPQYAHGVIDPVAEVGAVCARAKLPLHVDACVGGFVLPWVERLGRALPAWDFRVPAVTSISADLHKYAYAGKGASVLLWRSMKDMQHQFFVAADFPGGIYVSPTLIGTRPAARSPRRGPRCRASAPTATSASPPPRSRSPIGCAPAPPRSTGCRSSATATRRSSRSAPPPTAPTSTPWPIASRPAAGRSIAASTRRRST
jgi:sphinganine-1-phosphate aldolase